MTVDVTPVRAAPVAGASLPTRRRTVGWVFALTVTFLAIARTADARGVALSALEAPRLVAVPDPTTIAVADLDGEGRSEVLVGDRSGLSVLGGPDTGPLALLWEARGLYPVRRLLVGDVTGDGRLDVIALQRQGGRASVFAGRGDGTFDFVTHVNAGRGPNDAVLADVNGDGAVDLIAADQTGAAIVVCVGGGDGTFAAAEAVAIVPVPWSVEAALVDRDDEVDLLVTDYLGNAVRVLIGDGAGGFHEDRRVVVPSGPLDIETLDGGARWAVVCRGTDEIVTVDRTFAVSALTATGPEPSALRVFDVDEDGWSDLLVVDANTPIATLWRRPDGEPSDPIRIPLPRPATDAGVELTQADVRVHATLPPPGETAASGWVWSARVRSLDAIDPIVLPLRSPVGVTPATFARGDLNADGIEDLLVADQDEPEARPIFGTGAGTYVSHGSIPLVDRPTAIAVDDLDGDGLTDLVVTHTRARQLGVYWGAPDGEREASLIDLPRDPRDVAVGDVDGDGRADVVVACTSVDTLVVVGAHGTRTLEILARLGTEPRPTAPLLDDVTGDGTRDLLVASRQMGAVLVYPGLMRTSRSAAAGGLFGAPASYAVSPSPIALAVADATGDGIGDVVTIGSATSVLSVLPGRSDGSFDPVVTSDLSVRARTFDLRDLDGDGWSDLVLTDEAGGAVLVHPGAGGGFGPPLRFDLGAAPLAAFVADVDADERRDVVALVAAGEVAVARQMGAFPIVRLLDASAEPRADGVVVGWRAYVETPDVGVVLRRTDELGGDPIATWDALTPGLRMGDALDTGVAAPGRVEYVLVLVSTLGQRVLGTVSTSVSLAAPTLHVLRNPAHPRARVGVRVPTLRRSVRLDVLDVRGRRVRTLVDGVLAPGTTVVEWALDGRDGIAVGAGIYYLMLRSGAGVRTERVVVLR